MGCGSSRIGDVAAVGGIMPIPAGMRPLLRRRLEEIKKRSHVNVLKGDQTLSKKELLRHDSFEDGEETEEKDDILKSSAKVAPTPDPHVEEKKDVNDENVLSRNDVIEVKEEAEIMDKQDDNHYDDEANNVEKELGNDNDINNHDVDTINGDDNSINHDGGVINVKKEGDDSSVNHDGEGINITKEEDGINYNDEIINDKKKNDDDDEERMICPTSPSFRVYCINAISDDDEEENGEDTRKSMEAKSIIIEPKEEESIIKKEKRERKGNRFGIALPRKYLANVTAPCYAGGGGCMRNTQSRLLQEKSSQ